VRVLHSLSFVDDPTRMLRAVRFEQRFNFSIEQRTLQLITEARTLLRQLSGSRLRHEFDLILAEERPERMFARLQELDLLNAIHPALDWKEGQAAPLLRALREPFDQRWRLPESFGHFPIRRALAYLVWLMPLPIEEIQAVAEKLRLPAALQSALKTGQQLLTELPALASAPVSQVVERLESTPRPALYAIFCQSISPEVNRLIEKYLTDWQYIQIITDGKVLKTIGVTPGPIYSRILATLRAARLDGQIKTDEEERALLSQMVRAIAKFD